MEKEAENLNSHFLISYVPSEISGLKALSDSFSLTVLLQRLTAKKKTSVFSRVHATLLDAMLVHWSVDPLVGCIYFR